MVIFGFKTNENSPKVIKFIEDTNTRLEEGNLATNPFIGGIRSNKTNDIHIIKINPIYPNFTIFVWPLTIIITFIWGFGWWSIICALIILLGFFWSRRFFSYMLQKGLKVNGYKGPITILTPKELIDTVVFNGSK